MKCDGLPDPVCVRELNTYLSLWKEDDTREDIDQVYKNIWNTNLHLFSFYSISILFKFYYHINSKYVGIGENNGGFANNVNARKFD